MFANLQTFFYIAATFRQKNGGSAGFDVKANVSRPNTDKTIMLFHIHDNGISMSKRGRIGRATDRHVLRNILTNKSPSKSIPKAIRTAWQEALCNFRKRALCVAENVAARSEKSRSGILKILLRNFRNPAAKFLKSRKGCHSGFGTKQQTERSFGSICQIINRKTWQRTTLSVFLAL